MNKALKQILGFLFLLVFVSACTPASAQTAPTSQPSPIPATATPEPTATAIPTPTSMPGVQVFPANSLGFSIPWLPYDESAVPGVNIVAFNTQHPPFNNLLVRQAFAAAIDREEIAEMAAKYYVDNAHPATTLTPPEVLGRDLYNEIGIKFDPQQAKELLTQAGYTDPSAFPKMTFVVNSNGETAPGARMNMVKKMVEMWKNYLGIDVEVKVIYDWNQYGELLKNGQFDLYWFGWKADYNDPDNFLREIFHSGNENNFGKYKSMDFDKLVDDAGSSSVPVKRQGFYIEAETLLCQTDAAVIPLYFQTFH
jgi:oligopeptide transport system substrate-binding protein